MNCVVLPACQLALLLSLGTLSAASAAVTLPSLFTSHMVVQREQPIPVWGTANPGATLHLQFATDGADVVVGGDGRWKTLLQALPAGGPYELKIDGDGGTSLSDLLIGDIWLCSGQSNMEFPMAKSFGPGPGILNADAEIAAADHPQIRFFRPKYTVSETPLSDTVGPWTVCSPKTVWNCSAVAYYFAREIESRENVPIGLIFSARGGTPIEPWVPAEALQQAPDYPAISQRLQFAEASYPKEKALFDEKVAANKQILSDAKQKGLPPPKVPWIPVPEGSPERHPGRLFNGMIAPFTALPIRGVVWYQGEDNASRASEYAGDLAALISGWRAAWKEESLPFLVVQLPNFRPRAMAPGPSQWAEMREAQASALRLPQTAVAVTLDVGDPNIIHPSDKKTVGERLALAARNLVYGEKIEGSSPFYASMVIKDGKIRIHFSHADGGLRASDGKSITGFEIAGADQKFIPADAVIDGSDVIVSSVEVSQPIAVRYAWADNPTANLSNSDGLPVGSFRTDHNPH